MSKIDEEFEKYYKQFTIGINEKGAKYIRINNGKIVILTMNVSFANTLFYNGVYLAFVDIGRLGRDYHKDHKRQIIEICNVIDAIQSSEILTEIYKL